MKSFISTASIALVITSFAFIIIAILYIYAPEPAREETLVTTPTVEVFALEQPNAPITRDLHAKVFADKDVDLFAFHNTTVESVEKRAGQFVKKGDVILRLDAKDIQLKLEKEISKQAQLEAEMKMQKQQVSQTKEKLEQQQKVFELSKKQFDRYKKLHQSKALSRQKLDEAQQSLERERKILIDLDHSVDTQKSKVLVSEKNSNQQQIAISQVKSSLEKTIIKAPFVGRVDKIYVNQGDDIKQGAVLVRVMDDKNWHIRAFIPSRYVAEIKAALKQEEMQAHSIYGDSRQQLKPHHIIQPSHHPSLGMDLEFTPVESESNQHFLDHYHHQRGLVVRVRLPSCATCFAVPPSTVVLSKYCYLIDENQTVKQVLVNQVGQTIHKNRYWAVVSSPDFTAGSYVVLDPSTVLVGEYIKPKVVIANAQ